MDRDKLLGLALLGGIGYVAYKGLKGGGGEAKCMTPQECSAQGGICVDVGMCHGIGGECTGDCCDGGCCCVPAQPWTPPGQPIPPTPPGQNQPEQPGKGQPGQPTPPEKKEWCEDGTKVTDIHQAYMIAQGRGLIDIGAPLCGKTQDGKQECVVFTPPTACITIDNGPTACSMNWNDLPFVPMCV